MKIEIATLWLVIGFLGQICFFFRFFLQWIASERQKKSTFPTAFWYCSILGGGILLSYAVYRKDPVFILGQATGLLIYFRNLHFIRLEASRKAVCQDIA